MMKSCFWWDDKYDDGNVMMMKLMMRLMNTCVLYRNGEMKRRSYRSQIIVQHGS